MYETMQTKLDGNFTVLVLRDGGRAPLRVAVPKWLVSLINTSALTFLGFVGFFGWQLQAYGMQGQQVLYLGALDSGAERWTLFESLAPSRLTPSREELRKGVAKQRADRLGLGDRRAAVALLVGSVAPEWAAEAGSTGDFGNGNLKWPVENGWFGRGYGSGEAGYHLAVDIGGENGWDVFAAAPGIVGYAGKELHGYGNVVLVIHPGGWVTLYGHNQKLSVQAGERVRQGQPIALLGSTGRSMGPHVHFELIYQGRNCDPLPFVQSSEVAHLSAATPTPKVAWNPAEPKPSVVRCKRRMQHPQHEEDDDSLVGAKDAQPTSEPSG
jgi:murein DD-endopeptidase MepM/ murein hydrolase activator NlpD